MPYNPDRVIDTLRLFIDLVDVLHLEDDIWTSGSWLLSIISEYHRHNAEEGITGDVFLWTLEILGFDLWESFDVFELNLSMFWCLEYGAGARVQRLLELCKNAIDAREAEDGYSLLHKSIIDHNLMPLLTIGANPNLVGFDPEHSPRYETPISLSMYHANTFLTLQTALKTTRATLGATFDQALEQRPLQHSDWTKEALVELFSEDLNLSPILHPQRYVYPYCLYERVFMAQPYWMRILESIKSRTRSQSIQNIVRTMLSTSSQAAEVSRDDYDGADPDIEDEHLSDHDDKSISVQSDDEVTRGSSIYDDISVDDEDMCLFCWQEWEETGFRPSLDESKFLRCGHSLSSPECRGKGDYSELYCQYCSAKLQQADFAIKQQQKRRPHITIDSDKEEEDHYSPYLIHT